MSKLDAFRPKPVLRVGDSVRASKAGWIEHFRTQNGFDERPVRRVVRVDGKSVFVKGAVFDQAVENTIIEWEPDSLWKLEKAAPVEIGLDRPEKAVEPPQAVGDGIKRADNTVPADKESVLAEALRCTDGARQRDYGSAKVNHERIAAFWMLWDICRSGSEVTIERATQALRDICGEASELGADNGADDVAVKMILLKIARHANTPKRDNLVDIAGYARCSSRINGFED